jgi:hypothetical protein
MHYKDILKIKYPNKSPIQFIGDRYEDIVWNELDTSPNPSKEALDLAILKVLPSETSKTQIVEVKNGFTKEITDFFITFPNTQLIQSIAYAQVPPISGNSTIPLDNTKPLNTEGTGLAQISILPNSVGSKFRCSFSCMVDATSTGKSFILSLFRNGECINATSTYLAKAGQPSTINLDFVDAPNSVDQIIYELRIGLNSTATWFVNTTSNGVNFGGKATSSFIIMEIE